MPLEKSAGAVIFIKNKDTVKYLLLHYQAGHWDLPKGHIEKGETLEDTVKREVKEETGLEDIEIVPGFKETIKYFFRWEEKNIMKFVTFYVAETKEKDITISKEYIGFIWLPYGEALEKLTFKKAKDILQKVNDFLPKNSLRSGYKNRRMQ